MLDVGRCIVVLTGIQSPLRNPQSAMNAHLARIVFRVVTLTALPAPYAIAAPTHELVYSWLPGPGNPRSELVLGTDGNFYGTSSTGGATGLGSVFKMTPAGVVTTLVNFTGNGAANKGSNPQAGLVQAAGGDFYGTTETDGTLAHGT